MLRLKGFLVFLSSHVIHKDTISDLTRFQIHDILITVRLCAPWLQSTGKYKPEWFFSIWSTTDEMASIHRQNEKLPTTSLIKCILTETNSNFNYSIQNLSHIFLIFVALFTNVGYSYLRRWNTHVLQLRSSNVYYES